jgi:hypothetical protein
MGDRGRRLEIACRLADVLFGVEPARRRGEALDLLEVSELPTPCSTSRVERRAW